MRLESLKKDLEAIGKMFNESMKEYFEKKNGVIILNLVNLSIYENSMSPRDHSHSQSTMESQLGGVNSGPCTEIYFFFRKTMHRDIILALSSFLARGFFISTTYIYVYSYVSCIFIFIVKCRLSNKEIHLLCYLYDLFMFIVKSCLSNKEFQCKSVVKML